MRAQIGIFLHPHPPLDLNQNSQDIIVSYARGLIIQQEVASRTEHFYILQFHYTTFLFKEIIFNDAVLVISKMGDAAVLLTPAKSAREDSRKSIAGW